MAMELHSNNRNFWKPQDSDSDTDDEDEETLLERVEANSKVLYEVGHAWGKWGYDWSKYVTYEFFAHSFFVSLPFVVIIMQQQLDSQKWDHCTKVARQQVEKETMKSMGNLPIGGLPPVKK